MLSLLTFWSATFAVYLVLFTLLGGRLSAVLLLYPFIFLSFLAFTYGLGLLLSVLQVYYRDIRHIVDSILPLAFWLTPIAWMETMIPQNFHWLISLNPVAPFIRSFACVLHDNRLPSSGDLLLMAMLSLASLSLGTSIFSAKSAASIEKL